jgi:rhamnosyltransferase
MGFRGYSLMGVYETGMTPTDANPHSVAAIVVTFHPNAETLGKLISVLLSDGILPIVVDNGGGRAALLQQGQKEQVTLLDMGGNQGVGAAINIGLAESRRKQVTYVATFDQDSEPSPGMVATLVAEFVRQSGLGVKVGAVGPLFIDSRQDPPLIHPFVRLDVFGSGHRYCASDSDLISVDTLITSGCVTSLDVLADVGPMNQDYFVDYTDIEWCFRARSRGFELFGVCGAKMSHELGHGSSRSIFGLNLFEYSPARRYYYARNTISVARLNYVSFRWKVRLIAGLGLRCLTIPWAPRPDKTTLKQESLMLLQGIIDGIRGMRGPMHSTK